MFAEINSNQDMSGNLLQGYLSVSLVKLQHDTVVTCKAVFYLLILGAQ